LLSGACKALEFITVSKEAMQKFNEKLNLKKLNDVKVKEKCRVKISNNFANFGNFNNNIDITNTA
jgi:hypothetical protein